ncbi:MAG: signal peptidase I [Candidatus Omnitrophica bacterium]|nr:signal peptidase I [Candidatus Omnitrophota bacterium]
MENTVQQAKAEIYKRDIAKKGKLQITVIGNSMYPFLKNKDIIFLNPAKLTDIYVGDIVLTYNGMRMLCHRVFKINKDSFQTKADALIGPDLIVCENDLIGKVVEKISPKNKRRVNVLPAKWSGFFISRVMIIGAFFYIPARLLRKIWRALISFLSFQRQP